MVERLVVVVVVVVVEVAVDVIVANVVVVVETRGFRNRGSLKLRIGELYLWGLFSLVIDVDVDVLVVVEVEVVVVVVVVVLDVLFLFFKVETCELRKRGTLKLRIAELYGLNL